MKLTFFQDGIRNYLSVAKYAPEYETRKIQIEQEAKWLTISDGVKKTIMHDANLMREGKYSYNSVYQEVILDKTKIEANELKLRNAGKLEGKISLGVGILAALSAVAVGVATALQLSGEPTQEQTLLEKLGTLQMKIATTLHTVDAYTAWYVKTGQ